jgi:hypothetical protein
MTLAVPATAEGKCLLKAVAKSDVAAQDDATMSRRWVTLGAPADASNGPAR